MTWRRGVAEDAALLDCFNAAVLSNFLLLVGEGHGVHRLGIDDFPELGLKLGADRGVLRILTEVGALFRVGFKIEQLYFQRSLRSM